MQIFREKKINFCIFATLLLLFSGQVLAQKNTAQELIQEADRLFSAQKYIESLNIYQKVLQNGDYSPRMLLKMSFITESLQDYPRTLYYLSLYQVVSPKAENLEKMASIAAAHRLKGYEHSDFDVLISFYRSYFEVFILTFLLMGLGLFFLVLRRKKVRGELPARYGFVFILILGSFFYLLNFTEEQLKAVVAKDNTYLMNAPAAGATPVDILERGHRVEIIEQRDVWLKVRWQERTLYVHQDNLWIVSPKGNL